MTDSATDTILIKRYSRSRLYDMQNGCYVSLDQLRDWSALGVPFEVIDAETGQEVTRVLFS